VRWLVPTFEDESDETDELRQKFNRWWEKRDKKRELEKKVRKAEYPLERAKHSNDNDLSFSEAVKKEQQENAAKKQSIYASQQISI